VHRGYQPVHVTLRVRSGLASLRTQVVAELLRRAFRHSRREWFRIIHFSIQFNHLHLLVEAPDGRGLSRGASGLVIRCARRLNRLLGRRGAVFASRYHARELATPREVRAALVYVLHNARRHSVPITGIDPLSSGAVFDGWSDAGTRTAPPHEMYARYGVSPPTTWLARYGWRKHGLIATWEAPAR